MAKVVLEINDKELENFLTIVNSLKKEMVVCVDVDKKRSYNAPKPIQKEPLKPVSINSKYVDPQTFKERLKQQRMKKYGK